jgi:hypothetical protein
MLAYLTQQSAEAHDACTVELQSNNGCTTRRGDPNNFGEILTPNKVV